VAQQQKCSYCASFRKTVGKTSLEKPGHRRGHNIKTDLKTIRWGDVNWINLARDRDR